MVLGPQFGGSGGVMGAGAPIPSITKLGRPKAQPQPDRGADAHQKWFEATKAQGHYVSIKVKA
jgi:hypothetical protein